MKKIFKIIIAVVLGLSAAGMVTAGTVFAPSQEGTGTPTSGYVLKSNGPNAFASWQAVTYSESDPVYTSSSWYSTTNNSSNWNTAYGWGNPSGVYLPIAGTAADSSKLGGVSAASYVTGTPWTGMGYLTSASSLDPSKVSQTSSYRFVTDTEKGTWNGKQNAITTGTTAQYFKGDLSLGTFPTALSAFTNDLGNYGGFLTSSSSLDPSKVTQSATYRFVSDAEKSTWNGKATLADVAGVGYLTSASSLDPSKISQTSSYRLVTDTEKSTWNGKQNSITTGTTSQYFKGDLSLGTFPTALSAFTNDLGNYGGFLTSASSLDPSKVSQTASYRFVTDTEKGTWNGKQSAYTILSTLGGLANSSGWLKNDGAGVLSYSTPSKTDVGLGNVPNTDATVAGNITQDSTHRFATDTEKTAWNGKLGSVTGTNLDNVWSTTGILTRTGANTYSTITDSHSNWDTAYGWGNHASAGYALASNVSNDVATDASSTTKFPSVKVFKDYTDGLVAGLLDYRGAYDVTGTNAYPAAGGSGTAGAVMKGDTWVISVGGTMGTAVVQAGDSIIANTDTPWQTDSKWNVLNGNISYVPENVTNKVTSISGASTDTQYPSAKLLYDKLALKQNAITTGTTAQYFKGDLSLGTFPTTLASFTDDSTHRLVTDAEKSTWNAKLSSLTGAVLTDQTTPQTIGLTGSRLAKLWATDITVTNAITGSVTGNAGTVTGFSPTAGKTLSLSNSLTLSGTDGSTLAIGGGGTLGTAAYTASTAYLASGADVNLGSYKIGLGVANAGNALIEAKILNASSLQGYRIENDNIANIDYSSFVTGDGYVRFAFLGDGTLKWGSGSVAGDTNLYRAGANSLKTDDDFTANKLITTGGTSSQFVKGDGSLDNSTIGKAADVQVFDYTGGAQTWNKPSGTTASSTVEFIIIGGGAGGGSGRKGAASGNRFGGEGGGAGAHVRGTIQATLLGDTETVTVGGGGTGGASQTTNTSDGNVGTDGGSSKFSNFKASGGWHGVGGSTVAGGPNGMAQSNRSGIVPNCNVSTNGSGGATTATAGQSANSYPGFIMPGGGGNGGGITSGNLVSNGGAGGYVGNTTEVFDQVVGGTAGNSAGTLNGGDGSSSTLAYIGTGGGGGASSKTTNAGAGGNGATYGGAGGGGGASLNSVGNSGKGGDGAAGKVIIITHF